MTDKLQLYKSGETLAKWQDARPIAMPDVYRAVLETPEIINSLTQSEKIVVTAACKETIGSMQREGFYNKFAEMINYIARDIGYQKPIERYEVGRIGQMIEKYYRGLTTAEIKVAFELLMIGELDEFLPKNSNGEPDRSHYQMMSSEYFTKVLNAYQKRKSNVISKIQTCLPVRPHVITEQEKEAGKEYVYRGIMQAFANFRHSGKIEFPGISQTVWERFAYEELLRIGYASEIIVSDDDEDAAVSELIRLVDNKFEKEQIQKQGIFHSRVPATAHTIARRHAVRNAFEKLANENVKLDKLLKHGTDSNS